MIPQDAGLPDPSGQLPQSPMPREVPPVAGRVGEAAPLPPRLTSSLPPPPALSATPDVLSLLLALRRRWISAVLLGGTLASIAAIGMWFLLTPRATAFAKIQVAFSQQQFFPTAQAAQNDFKTYLQTTAGRITSRPVIWAALKRDEVKLLRLEAGDPDPVQTIEEDLTVEFKENSEILTIQFKHADPVVATTVANAIKDAYFDDFVYAERENRARRVNELEKAQAEANQSITTKKERLKELARSRGVTDPGVWRDTRMEAVTDLRQTRHEQTTVQLRLAETRAQLDIFDARVKAMSKRGKDSKSGEEGTDKISEDEIQEAIESALDRDPQGKRLRDQLDDLEMQIEDFAKRNFRPSYVSYRIARERAGLVRKQLDKRLATLGARVRKAAARSIPGTGSPLTPLSATQLVSSPEEIKAMRDQLQKQIQNLVAMDDQMSKRITNLAATAASIPVKATDYEHLAEEIKSEEMIVARLRENLEREKVELRAASRITKFQDAELMKKDIKKQLLATLVAPLAVLCSVCGGLALLEHRQRKVRSASEISRGLGIRVVGAVPRMPNLERHLVGPAGESDLEGTPVMESIDAIRTRLLHEADVRSTRVVMVSSATAGEGKTTLASALASSLARAGRKTLLLDGDLRRPTLHELFEMPMQPGFSEVLLGEIEIADATVESPQENLYLMPAGQWDREVLLALSRGGLEGVFEKLAEEFDFVVVDSHPVLSATDSLLIGRQADAVVLSVLHDVSQMPRVYAAHQHLTALGIRVLGAVVNGTNPEDVFSAPAMATSAA